MVSIRLSRGGMKNKPFYRIVAIDKSSKREGEPLDILGYWNPVKDDFKIDKEKLDKWRSQGAQISSAVGKLIQK
jgi:small subunit ribosomal protein S16